MRSMSHTAQADSDMLTEALTSLRIEIKSNRRLMKRTAALVKVQEERAKAIEARLNVVADRSDRPATVEKSEPLYAAVLKTTRRYCIATGRPLTRHDILYWLGVEGYTLDVSNPERFVSKNIWMSKQFVAFEEGFWPSDLPQPDGVTPNRRKKNKNFLILTSRPARP